MLFDRIDPCSQCPFRRASAPGWLGSYTPDGVIAAIQCDQPFPCHPTVNYDDPDWERKVMAPDSKAQHCAGFFILMRHMRKLPRDPEQYAQSKRLDMTAEVFRTPAEFLAHHSTNWRKKR